MTSTHKTLDYLVSAPHEQHIINTENTNKNTNKKHHHTKKERPPPVIPPSPSIKPDELVTLQTDLLLRKFELDAAHQSWQQNTVQSAHFHNARNIEAQLERFGVEPAKYQYQSLIKHCAIHKSKITELVEEGQAMHIVTQFTDVGCPTLKNPNTKKGCWCIEETKKQKKSHQRVYVHHPHHFQPVPVPLLHSNGNHAHSLSHAPAVLLAQNVLHSNTTHKSVAGNNTTNSNNASLAMLSIQQYFKNINVANQQQSAATVPSHHRFMNMNTSAASTVLQGVNAGKASSSSVSLPKVVNVSNPCYASLSKHSSPHNTHNTHTHKTALNKAATSTMGMIQNNLISNARTQHYTPSNRMQQIRMQQMLLTARTQHHHLHQQNAATAATSNGGGNDKKRQHKDTIVFDAKVGEPPIKKRKKSRWSSK
mmetsp:Transcript_49892/g.79523  ORF Transcript_49892/g.79523 Transcript_49892/m.79523 type:complete len:422 (+) Transcript_49892:146-1411(+)